MIDGIKTYDLKTNPERLVANPHLLDCWTTAVHNADGIVKYELAEYLGLKFRLKHNKVRLQGSLHKYRNNGRHNYDDFTAVEVGQVVKELLEQFEIDITHTALNNVEFGVNVVLPFEVSLVLNNLIVYKGEPFIKVVEDGISYYQCKKTHFIIKIYDKGKQYNLPYNLLRFEIKVMRMQYLETKGITLRYLSDLLNMNIYEPLGNILTEVFEGILFGDNTIHEKALTAKELETYLRGSNPNTWTPQQGETKRKRLFRLENDFKEVLEQHRKGVNFRIVVSELIRAKSLALSRFYQVNESGISLEIVPFLPTENQEKKTLFVPFLHFSYSVKTGHTQNTYSDEKVKLKIKLCSGCGKPIEPNKLYHSLDCKKRRDERNARSNNRNNFKRRFKKLMSKPSLFDFSETIKLTDEQRDWIA